MIKSIEELEEKIESSLFYYKGKGKNQFNVLKVEYLQRLVNQFKQQNKSESLHQFKLYVKISIGDDYNNLLDILVNKE